MEAVFFRLVVEIELWSAIYMAEFLSIPQLSSEVSLFREYWFLAHEANHFEVSFRACIHTKRAERCLWGLLGLQVA